MKQLNDKKAPSGATWSRVVIAATSLTVAGCAHVPDATVGYYLPQTNVSVTVIQTVGCDKSDHVIVVSLVTPKVEHVADRDNLIPFSLSNLKGPFSDSDFTLTMYDDGRIKGVNATSQGQGDAIVSAVVKIVGTVGLFSWRAAGPPPPTYPEACKTIADAAGDKKVLTLTYQGPIDLRGAIDASQDIPADPASAFYARALKPAIGQVCGFVREVKSDVPAPVKPGTDDAARFTVREPGRVKLQVKTGRECSDDTWTASIPAGQFGTRYDLPIPRPAVFGKQVFAAAFAESGALTSIQYSATGGSADALNSLNSLLTAAKGPSAADKVAEVKAQADLIVQQQRLAKCLADLGSCI